MFKSICYLTIPSFYWQINALFYPENTEKPVLIGGSTQDHGIVMETSPAAASAGIRPGMLSFHARNLLPDVEIIHPDEETYDYFIKKIKNIIEKFSVKWVQEKYNSFLLFLPDYFNLLSTVKEIQYDIRKKLNFNTQAGLSDNKYMARLAGRLSGPNELLHVDKNNAAKILSSAGIEHIPELTGKEIEKLHLAGADTIHDLFGLDLYHLRFFLGDKGEMLYYNYICQVKTMRDKNNFFYNEIFFYNTCNDLKAMIDKVKKNVRRILHEKLKQDDIMINRIKIYMEYVDNKDYILTKKILGKNSTNAIIRHIASLLQNFTRRVRIKKIGLYFFHTQKEAALLNWGQTSWCHSLVVPQILNSCGITYNF